MKSIAISGLEFTVQNSFWLCSWEICSDMRTVFLSSFCCSMSRSDSVKKKATTIDQGANLPLKVAIPLKTIELERIMYLKQSRKPGRRSSHEFTYKWVFIPISFSGSMTLVAVAASVLVTDNEGSFIPSWGCRTDKLALTKNNWALPPLASSLSLYEADRNCRQFLSPPRKEAWPGERETEDISARPFFGQSHIDSLLGSDSQA